VDGFYVITRGSCEVLAASPSPKTNREP